VQLILKLGEEARENEINFNIVKVVPE